MTDEVLDTQPRVGWTWKKWVLVCLLSVLAVGFLYYVVTLFQVMRAGRQTDPDPAEAIVVLGAAQYDGRPSPQLAARLDHAIELYDEGVAPVVMVTGGNQPGDRFTEAEASANYLVDRGVPESAIMREDAGQTTYESLSAAADQLLATDRDDVVIVTDPYHSLRSRLIADEVGLDASLSPTPTSVVTGWSSFQRELEEAAGVAVGRIIGFERLSGLTG
jgi:vancomycin permeability regulator SanA